MKLALVIIFHFCQVTHPTSVTAADNVTSTTSTMTTETTTATKISSARLFTTKALFSTALTDTTKLQETRSTATPETTEPQSDGTVDYQLLFYLVIASVGGCIFGATLVAVICLTCGRFSRGKANITGQDHEQTEKASAMRETTNLSQSKSGEHFTNNPKVNKSQNETETTGTLDDANPKKMNGDPKVSKQKQKKTKNAKPVKVDKRVNDQKVNVHNNPTTNLNETETSYANMANLEAVDEIINRPAVEDVNIRNNEASQNGEDNLNSVYTPMHATPDNTKKKLDIGPSNTKNQIMKHDQNDSVYVENVNEATAYATVDDHMVFKFTETQDSEACYEGIIEKPMYTAVTKKMGKTSDKNN